MKLIPCDGKAENQTPSIILHKSFKYRLYPTKKHLQSLEYLLSEARHLYNSAIQERRDAYKTQHKSLNYYDQANQLKEIRDAGNLNLNFSACQDVLRRVDKTFRAFFRRIKSGEKVGYPRFKGRDRFGSITFPSYGDGVKIRDGRLYIQNAGLVKIKVHRSLEGEINTVAIKRQCGKWYAIFSNTVDIEPLPVVDRVIGIDVGLESFAVASDGEIIDNPRCLRASERKLTKAQRKVSRRKKGGKNRRKAVALLAKHHLIIKNQRKDFVHKVSRKLVDTYGFIAVEDLQIKNMVRNHSLAKSISDASWGQFLNILSYKAEEAGRNYIRVNPNGTSQICSSCGALVPKSLSVRIHTCPECGVSLNRDLNAARNILRLGLSLWDLTWQSTASVSQEAVCFS